MNENKLPAGACGLDEGLYPLNRREFLQNVGTGIVILFTVGDAATQARRRGRREPLDFNAYLRIGEDGTVKCFTGKIEMGQGIDTSLAQSLADELDVALESVEMVMGDTALCPYDMGTWGSMTTPYFGPALRAAGAEARAVLMGLAAVRLKVPPERLDIKDGVVFDKTRKNVKVTYAQLAQGKKITRHLEQRVPVKKPSQFKIIGKPHARIDAVAKVTGKAHYTGDIRVDGMLCANILQPPAHGARLKSLDTSAVDKMEGCRVVRDGEMVAVLHQHPDLAEKALSQIKAEYDIPEARFDDKTVFKYFLDHAGEGRVTQKDGDLEAGHKLAGDVFDHKYFNSYVAHAPMETHSALAQFKGGNLTVWASTQTPFGLQRQLANDLKIPIDSVRVITPYVGGGFGGKGSDGQATQAAKLAKIVGKPVQVVWTRADEFFYDTFRPAAVVTIKSGMTGAGKIVSWDYNIYGMGGRGSNVFYDVPNYRITIYRDLKGGERMHTLGTGAWRAPDNNTNSFARESHIDIMASKAGTDPLEFRLNNISDPKMRGVLQAAAKKFGWTPGKTPSGRGVGLACGIDVRVPVALMAEVEVDKQSGHVQVKRVVCAQDMGLVVNPEGATMQAEGCITMGLGYALSEEVHFKGGKVLDLDFGTYELPRFSWVPQIDVVLIEASDQPSKGGGEPAIINVGAVIANAIHDATGARLFQLPMTPERIKQAMA
jgi:CO/xanthine dehydrogenase Mo-binding subunit